MFKSPDLFPNPMNVTFHHHEGVLQSTTVGLKGQEVLRQPPFMAMGQARHLPLYRAFHIHQQQKLSAISPYLHAALSMPEQGIGCDNPYDKETHSSLTQVLNCSPLSSMFLNRSKLAQHGLSNTVSPGSANS